MALVPWEPREMKHLRDFFGDVFDFDIIPQSRRLRRRWLEGGEWSPLVDVIDKKDKIIAKAELPGVDKKDIKITLSDNTLTIRGERKEERETKKEDYYCCERVQGSYSRTIALPVEVDNTKIKASFKNGVLEVTLPKAEEVKPKEIEIKPE
ncbi:MAG: Hsp20/alpha crystallin family protein [Candidatus Bathyarchaeota archaeon]|nr:Hsp20/alpha crystallin family protein [Candidatus Bathyarchaeota archaeon]